MVINRLTVPRQLSLGVGRPTESCAMAANISSKEPADTVCFGKGSFHRRQDFNMKLCPCGHKRARSSNSIPSYPLQTLHFPSSSWVKWGSHTAS